MPEEQAFCVLVKIMYEYGLRALYKNNFEDLHCKFYQLERLMQVSDKIFNNVRNAMECITINVMDSNMMRNMTEDNPDCIDGQLDVIRH